MGITKFLEASVLMERALKTAKPIVESVAKNSRNMAAKKTAAVCLQQSDAALKAAAASMIKCVAVSCFCDDRQTVEVVGKAAVPSRSLPSENRLPVAGAA